MSSTERPTRPERPASPSRSSAFRGLAGTVRSGLVAAWGGLTGLAPHVLHHVGPVAGAAVVTGTGGTALFGLLGVVLSVPFLLRLRRRFGTWKAPAIALAVFVVMFSISTVASAALFGDEGRGGADVELPAGHDQHH